MEADFPIQHVFGANDKPLVFLHARITCEIEDNLKWHV